MHIERTPIGWQFWLQWIVATSVSWGVGAALSAALDLGVPGGIGEVAGETIWGLFIGIGQWLVLRRWLERAGWWVLASAAGWLLAASVGVTLQAMLGENVGGLIYTLGLGLVPGILQWLLLRQQIARAGWWILASTVLVFGTILVGVVTGSSVGLKEGELGFSAVAGIVSGVVFAITSGLILIWLLRRPVTTPTPVRTEAP